MSGDMVLVERIEMQRYILPGIVRGRGLNLTVGYSVQDEWRDDDMATGEHETREVRIGDGPLVCRVGASRRGKHSSSKVHISDVLLSDSSVVEAVLTSDDTVEFRDTGTPGETDATIVAEVERAGGGTTELEKTIRLNVVEAEPDTLELEFEEQGGGPENPEPEPGAIEPINPPVGPEPPAPPPPPPVQTGPARRTR